MLYVFYSTWVFKWRTDNGDALGSGYGLLDLVLAVIIGCLLLFFLYIEIRQLIFHKLEYFKGFWNFLDFM